ncbi:LysR family transcriptional regulator [Variovorax sp. J22R133]|uniref:LysR family transcriptional regulator n=1 Tax=Variovorax brevis TaxID=3053503 RepID=UPI002574D0F7|nr:LysR family transcriptional regulator [Variovorax sp. J22R133]MDM0114197.1 LysR family transcriptional regulator [Variovorax sp. J22R133]
MDINLARTFLEIVATRSFQRAAERLHVTQTSVSARVRTLEELLGRTLFVRNKAGAALTVAGEHFLPHATTLVQVWERARQQVAVPTGSRAVLSVGCEVSLWHPLLPRWLMWMRARVPDLAIRTEVDFPRDLLDQVAAGVLDIAIAYAPQQRPGLRVELLIEEKLIMVTTDKRLRTPQAAHYVNVDWGPEFAAQHDLAFPELSNAPVRAGLGPLGLEYVLAAGGTGYFRLDVVRSHLESGRLRRVPGTPEYLYPAYAVYAVGAEPTIVDAALEGLRQVANPTPKPATTRAKAGKTPRPRLPKN